MTKGFVVCACCSGTAADRGWAAWRKTPSNLRARADQSARAQQIPGIGDNTESRTVRSLRLRAQ